MSNTSPVLNLAIIGKLSLLEEQFGQIEVPRGVLDELRVDEDLPGSQPIREAMAAGWLTVHDVADSRRVHDLRQDLDRGESEAIVLALERRADLVLIDEREGRAAATGLGLRVAGLLGVLILAWQRGRIRSLDQVVQDLRELAGFRIGPELLARLSHLSGGGA